MKKQNSTKTENQKAKAPKLQAFSSLDLSAHYDLDGISMSKSGVVVAGDNQTTRGAPPPQDRSSQFRIPSGKDQNALNKKKTIKKKLR